MATTNNQPVNGDQSLVMVRATVILRIPDLDTNELTALYKMVQNITAQFGGEFDVTTSPQPSQTR